MIISGFKVLDKSEAHAGDKARESRAEHQWLTPQSLPGPFPRLPARRMASGTKGLNALSWDFCWELHTGL